MDKEEWIKKYEPAVDQTGQLISYDAVDDLEFINEQDPNKVWFKIP